MWEGLLSCTVRGCDGVLNIEKNHFQEGTNDRAFTMRCSKTRRHKFFIVEKVGKLIRMMDDTRWEKPG